MFHFTLPRFGRRKPAPLPHVVVPPRDDAGRFISAKPNRRSELERAIEIMPEDLRRDAREFALTTPLTDKQREQGRGEHA